VVKKKLLELIWKKNQEKGGQKKIAGKNLIIPWTGEK